MQFNINLASQPYEAAREYRRLLSAAIAVVALITALLVGYIIQQRVASRDINRQIADAEQEISNLDREKAQAQAILNRPANRAVADQSLFLNELFARKALSWTRVFSEMERIMPPGIHVVSMKPDYTTENQLLLHMVVATDSRDRAVELVRHMEKSNHFRQPQVVAENVLNAGAADQSGSAGGNIQFDIAAIYLPNIAAATAAGDEDNGEPVDEKKPAVDKKSAEGRASTNTNASAYPNNNRAQNRAPVQGHH
jgi:type IV pilus assembly protein PilN